MLTAADLNPPEDVEAMIESLWGEIAAGDENANSPVPRGKLRDFAEERVRGVLEKRDFIDGVLSSLLDNWELDRLGTVERTVLRMGIWELSFSDVPKAVAINEAIDLANWFSTPKARTLVNAVLDKYAKRIKDAAAEGGRA